MAQRFEGFIGVDFWTALFVLLNTLAIFFVARKFLFQPVHKMITDRQQEIDSMYADAGKAKADAEAMADEYRRKLTDAQAVSERMVKDAVARAQDREEEIVHKANQEAAAILDKAIREVAREKRKAVDEAKKEVSSLALSIAEKVVGRELTEEDQARMVEEFIDDLGEES